MNKHSFAHDGVCRGCAQTFAGCSFCSARTFGAGSCSCPVEAIHIARALRWSMRKKEKPTTKSSGVLDQVVAQ